LQTHQFCEAHQSYHEAEPKLLFVGGLSLETNDILLAKHFSEFGTVTSVHIQRRSSGKSKGFAYLQFLCPDSVKRAISIKNQIVLGSVITVQLAFTQEQKQALETSKLKRKIFVSGIPPSFDASRVGEYFGRIGPVESIIQFKAKALSAWKTCFVVMKSQESASQICAGRRLVIEGITFSVKPFTPSHGAISGPTATKREQMLQKPAPPHRQTIPTANDFKLDSVGRTIEHSFGCFEVELAVSKFKREKVPTKSVTGADLEQTASLKRTSQFYLKIRPGLHIVLAPDQHSLSLEASLKHTFIVRDHAKMRAQLAGLESKKTGCSEPNLVFNVGKW